MNALLKINLPVSKKGFATIDLLYYPTPDDVPKMAYHNFSFCNDSHKFSVELHQIVIKK